MRIESRSGAQEDRGPLTPCKVVGSGRGLDTWFELPLAPAAKNIEGNECQ
jgi:hypothetical protein